MKTSAFLSRGLIVNYTGKRGKKKKERKHSEEENNLKLLKPMQTLAHSHFSLGKQRFMPQIWGSSDLCHKYGDSDVKLFFSIESGCVGG